jgi:hypothetical protein
MVRAIIASTPITIAAMAPGGRLRLSEERSVFAGGGGSMLRAYWKKLWGSYSCLTLRGQKRQQSERSERGSWIEEVEGPTDLLELSIVRAEILLLPAAKPTELGWVVTIRCVRDTSLANGIVDFLEPVLTFALVTAWHAWRPKYIELLVVGFQVQKVERDKSV